MIAHFIHTSTNLKPLYYSIKHTGKYYLSAIALYCLKNMMACATLYTQT